MLLLAQLGGYSFLHLLVIIIAVVACVAIAYVVLTKGFGVEVPAWFTQIAWIVAAAVLGIVAILFVASLV